MSEVSDVSTGTSEPRNNAPDRFSWSAGSSNGSSIWDTRGQPVTDDPFLRPPSPPPPPPGRSSWLVVVAVTSTLLFLGASGAAVWFWRASLLAAAPPSAPASAAPAASAAPTDQPSAPAPGAAVPPASQPASADSLPRKTTLSRIGKIAVVDVGVEGRRTLAEELAEQRALAQAESQTLLLMTTRYGSQGFRDVDAALTDPLLQAALTNVRLVRTDVVFFQSELTEIGVPTDAIPWFALLGPDLTPRDGIDGGEWDDDIARNIAPVLGAFVHGSYKTRRQTWKPPKGKGVEL